jgi:hypothetical protein
MGVLRQGRRRTDSPPGRGRRMSERAWHNRVTAAMRTSIWREANGIFGLAAVVALLTDRRSTGGVTNQMVDGQEVVTSALIGLALHRPAPGWRSVS